MKIEILDTKKEGKSTCYLVRATLHAYLQALPNDFDEFHIQRDRTNNVYLDRLIETVIKKAQIPTLVLVAENVNERKGEAVGLKILDGLQRTLRLKVISDSIQLAKHVELDNTRTQILREFGSVLNEKNIDASAFFRVIEEAKKGKLEALASCLYVDQWFEIWAGLSEEDQVTKMLLLNAGHKPVKTRHQLELLFLGVLHRLEAEENEGFNVIREKEQSSILFTKNRTQGDFHFAAIVASLVAFFLGKPVTTNSELISDLQNDYSENSTRRVIEGFTYKFAKQLTTFLVDLDQLLVAKEGDNGTQWLGREVVLVGIFAALGDFCRDGSVTPQKAFRLLLSNLERATLNLAAFEQSRKGQDLARINLGVANKRAVFRATQYILTTDRAVSLRWSDYFGEA